MNQPSPLLRKLRRRKRTLDNAIRHETAQIKNALLRIADATAELADVDKALAAIAAIAPPSTERLL